jgi:cation diffusion facilitator CzcD-associated flavoprotein CzcO
MTNESQVDEQAQRALFLLGPDPANWVPETPGVDHDVVVVGGGQSGITIAFALRRAGIAKFSVIDASSSESASAWRTKARMLTLRTPKTRSGPELGIPELGFRAWYEGLHGKEAYDEIGRIATHDWADYLSWFHRQIGVEVRYSTRLNDIEPVGEHFKLHLTANGEERVETTRKIVLATGVEGTGAGKIPSIFDGLPRHLYSHSSEAIQFSDLRGKSVGVLGAATSALDAAATALEAGADEVHLFSYRPELSIVNPGAANPNPGLQDSFHLQPDSDRWNAALQLHGKGSSAPLDSVKRVANFPNFYLHLQAPWQSLKDDGNRVAVEAADGIHVFDFLIVGAGYQYDPSSRPELRRIAEKIALWEDRFQPNKDKESSYFGKFPYVGSGYELLEKVPDTAPWLRNIHVFSAASSLSFGRPVGDIPSLRTGVPRLVNAITNELFFDTRALRVAPAGQGTAESFADEYVKSIWRSDSVEVSSR